MDHRVWHTFGVVLVTLLLLGAAIVWVQAAEPEALPNGATQSAPYRIEPAISAGTTYSYTTVITVTSGQDPDTSKSYTCASPPADGLCTLRRAIVESRNLAPSALPVLIRFDIPQDGAEGYDSSRQIWKIQIHDTTDLSIFRRIKGGVIIDGETQPNGRATGPKVFIVGPGTGQKDGLIVGDVAGDDGIVVQGLGFQNLKTHIIVGTDDNLIENNWFGLNDDGTAAYLRNDDPEDGSGSAGVAFNGAPSNNIVRYNVFLGFDGVAAAIRGEGNIFEDNLVGTQADGSVAKQTDPSLICTTVDWLGGGGISVEGDAHRIENNVFAGLRQEIFKISTQPPAIGVDGDDHIIQNNQIGIDGTAAEVGVCGRGIYLIGANTPDHTQVLSNTIVNPGMSAVSINGALTDANTLRNNTIKKTSTWGQVEGNPEPEDAIQFGPSVPDALREFRPARVTSIKGTTVRGTSGINSPCPNCIIEVFLDDTDVITEALESMALVTADASGDWVATLSAELESDQGLRTTSTTAQYNTIPFTNAGTTTKLSDLYTAAHKLFLPMVVH
jgi:hypothetical protein